MQKSKKKKSTNTIVLLLLVVIITIIVLLLNAFGHHNKKITTITSDKALQLSKYSNNVNVIQDPLVLWSSDFHIATIADIKHFLSSKNVKIIDKVN